MGRLFAVDAPSVKIVLVLVPLPPVVIVKTGIVTRIIAPLVVIALWPTHRNSIRTGFGHVRRHNTDIKLGGDY